LNNAINNEQFSLKLGTKQQTQAQTQPQTKNIFILENQIQKLIFARFCQQIRHLYGSLLIKFLKR